MSRRAVRNLALALSLANLCLVGIWAELIPFLYLSENYPIGAYPCSRDFVAVILNTMLLAGVFFTAARLLDSTSRSLLRSVGSWTFPAVLLIPLNAIRTHFNTYPERWWSSLGNTSGAIVATGILVASIVLLWRRHRLVTRGAMALLLMLLPFTAVTFGQATWGALTSRACRNEGRRAPARPHPSATRVVWMIFDELEQRASFDERPASLELPELDRIRRQAVYATQASAPGPQTELSIPASIAGRFVSKAYAAGSNDFYVTFADTSGAVKWGTEPDIFMEADRRGMNTAVAGWFLPYCPALGAHLTRCSWEPCTTCGRRVGAFGWSLTESMLNQLSELVPRYGPRRHIAAYRAILKDAVETASDPRIGLALLHFPVPHAPWIYDRERRKFVLWNGKDDGYYDNLALVDETLGRIREAMERSHLWNQTTVFVTGDHGWRDPKLFGGRVDHRVPFLLKLPGQTLPVTFDRPFNAILIHDITKGILDGQIEGPDAVARWLEWHTSTGSR